MDSISESQFKVAHIPNHQLQSRWLPTLASLRYQAGNLDTYLEELVSGLRHGLGASRVMLGQCSEPGIYQFMVSPDLQLWELENPDWWTVLVGDIVAQRVSELGVYTLQPGLTLAYCGVVLESSQRINCGILLALRPAIEPFQVESQQVLALMANQAIMAIELENRCCTMGQVFSVARHPTHAAQDKLTVVNQQLHQKLGQYRAELQRVSVQLQMAKITYSCLEKRFYKIFEGSNDAIFVLDLAQDKILEVNPRATELLSYSRRELLNSVKISQVHPNEMLQLEQFIQTVFQKGQGWTDELTCLTKVKDKLPVEISALPIEFDGQLCVLAMVRDISERQRLTAARKQAEMKAEHTISHLAEVGELTSMIVHEIRNPLTTVLMGLTSFKQLNLDNRFQSRLNIALAEAERLKRLLNEILLFSKPQSLNCKPLDLNKWSANLLCSIESHPSMADRVIEFTANPISAIVLADSDKLKQVFINLITNACEAIMPGETIIWEIICPSKADHLTVRIHNGGKSIPPSILEKITTPFFTTKSNGNGLGLAIVKRIVDAHHGQLSIMSKAQDGTTVTVTLPVLN